MSLGRSKIVILHMPSSMDASPQSTIHIPARCDNVLLGIHSAAWTVKNYWAIFLNIIVALILEAKGEKISSVSFIENRIFGFLH
jgi:hypothetical protein